MVVGMAVLVTMLVMARLMGTMVHPGIMPMHTALMLMLLGVIMAMLLPATTDIQVDMWELPITKLEQGSMGSPG
jgi:hypothetical protein